MLSVDPPDHSRLRGLATPGFTRTRLAGARGPHRRHRRRPARRARRRGDGPVDLVAGFALPLPFSVIGELLGIDAAGQQRSRLVRDADGAVLRCEPPPEAVAASDHIVGFLNDLVDRRLADPTEDLVGDLARAAGNEGASPGRSCCPRCSSSSSPATTPRRSLIGNGVAALLAHPDQRDALVADPSLVPRAVEEFLRYDAPVPHSTFRYAAEDVTIAGTVIPAGVQVIVNLAAAGRDPAATPTPDPLDVAAVRRPPGLRARHPPLPGRPAGPAGGGDRVHRAVGPLPGAPARRTPELRWDHGDGLVLRGLSALPVRISTRLSRTCPRHSAHDASTVPADPCCAS